MKTVIVIFAFGMVISSINAYAEPGVKGERKPPQKAVDGCVDISDAYSGDRDRRFWFHQDH